jgi:hypothetical protein
MKPASYFSRTQGLVKHLCSLGLTPQVSYTSRIEVPKQKEISSMSFQQILLSATATKRQFQQLVYFYIALREINNATKVNQDNTKLCKQNGMYASTT